MSRILTESTKPRLKPGEARDFSGVKYTLMCHADGYVLVRVAATYPRVLTERFWVALRKIV